MSAINAEGKCKIPQTACRYCRDHPGENGFPVDCPHGFSKEKLPILTGDRVGSFATPIAKFLKRPCVDQKSGQLKPNSDCAKKKRLWNRDIVLSKRVVENTKS